MNCITSCLCVCFVEEEDEVVYEVAAENLPHQPLSAQRLVPAPDNTCSVQNRVQGCIKFIIKFIKSVG